MTRSTQQGEEEEKMTSEKKVAISPIIIASIVNGAEIMPGKFQGVRPPLHLQPFVGPGCYAFDNGTVQGWSLDQLYDTSTQNQLTPLAGLFVLVNSQNTWLAATTASLVAVGTQQCDIYLESPDLSSNSDWQGVLGYGLDVDRTITSACGDQMSSNPMYFAQMQMRVIDTSNNTPHLFAEWDPVANNWIFHVINLNTTYHFDWKPSFLTDKKYKVKSVRVRFTMPNPTGFGPGTLECALFGSWLISNVCPIK